MAGSHYPNGFANGVSIKGMPILNTYANKVFWVSSTTGSNGNDGTNARPFATIDYAVGRCTASKGDIIMVMPGHTETLTSQAIVVDVAGVSVVGLGNGEDTPQLIYDHTSAEVSIAASSVLWQNIRHTSSVTGVVVGITVEAGAIGCTIRDCKFDVVAAGTDEFNLGIDIAVGANDTTVEGCHMDNDLGGAVAGISLTGASNNIKILNNYIIGDYSTANVQGVTTLSTNVFIKGNTLINGEGGAEGTEPGIQLLTGSTGTIADNYIGCNLATIAAAIVADTCMMFENYYVEVAPETGVLIGTASADD